MYIRYIGEETRLKLELLIQNLDLFFLEKLHLKDELDLC